jgi:hypothetical protein
LNPNTIIRTSRSFLKTIAYARKLKVAQGQSSQIATMRSKEANESVAILLDMKLPDAFNYSNVGYEENKKCARN